MASHIPRDFVQELIARVDIVDVINARVPLTPAGREFKACCPFHNEKTPSFYVSPAKQFYHCFGCGESGTSIQFLMKYGNYRFFDAVEELASSIGMELPREYSHSYEHGAYTQLLELMEKVNSEYQRQLYKNPESAAARQYLKDRGITFDAAQEFGLGYAPDEWSFVLNKYGQSNASKKQLEEAGLITSKEGNKHYDRFRGRLMFPIEDRRGRVIAFGGRVIGEGEPKYLNSPETTLFKKGNELFGLKKALSAIKAEEKVVVVEGYTDVVVLAQFGVCNAVATLGTAVTQSHVRELLRTVHEIAFCFDGDEAGKRAAWRAVESILPAMEDGHLVSFVFLPQGQDPDSMVREEGGEAFRERMQQGEPIVTFISKSLQNRSDLRRKDGQAKFAKEFGKVIEKLEDGMLRRLMLSEISEHTDLEVSELRYLLKPPRSEHGVSKASPTSVRAHSLTGRFITLLLHKPEWGELATGLEDVAILKAPNIDLLVEVLKHVQREPESTTASIVEKFRSTEYFRQVQLYAGVRIDSDPEALKQNFFGILMKLQELISDRQNKILVLQSGSAANDADYETALQRVKDKHERKKKAQEGRGFQ